MAGFRTAVTHPISHHPEPKPAAGVPPPGRPGGHRRAVIVAAVVVLLAVAAVAGWADSRAGGYYAFQPGTAPTITTSSACRANSAGSLVLPGGTPCARIVAPAGRATALHGQLLMVDVYVGKATPIEYALRAVGLLGSFFPGSQLLPDAAVLGTTPASQYACQDNLDMGQATTTAPLVAMSRLGYHVGSVNHGGSVYLVLPHSAASTAGLHCGDRIVAVDGTATPTAAAVASAIHAHRPGDRVSIRVRRATSKGTRTLTLQATLTGVPAIAGQPAHPSEAFLGVETQTDTTYNTPFPVQLQVGNIGGPSAGLAMTLATLDALSGGTLTGGHVVAATGTISPNGAVGDVGGVAQKTVAVERAGATLFLVPPQELAVARRVARPGLVVKPVSTLSQALADLSAIGGHVPAPAG